MRLAPIALVVFVAGCHATDTYAVRRAPAGNECVEQCRGVFPPETTDRLRCMEACPGVGVQKGDCADFRPSGQAISCTEESERYFAKGRTLVVGLVIGLVGVGVAGSIASANRN